MENKQLLEMASVDGLYINRAEACMVLDWTVFYVFFYFYFFLIPHASANHCLPEGVSGGGDECC